MIKKLIANIPAVIIIVLFAWIALSWVDAVLDNTAATVANSAFNFFEFIAKGATV